ncbi:hypothetical protein [Halalkalibacter oceani]|uniref:hypothetical protein n=1 Tax=Halalkalibacter oceani TaxID=1653776 RepID=UPI003393DEBB
MRSTTFNPMDRINFILEKNGIFGKADYIVYDSNLTKNNALEFSRSLKHDGTFYFTDSLIEDVLLTLINKKIVERNKLSNDDIKKLKDIRYRIGNMTLETEFGVPVKHFTGSKDTVKIPIKIEYIFG